MSLNVKKLISTNTASQSSNIDVESAIIGVCLLEKDGISRVYNILDPEMFFFPGHKMVYEAMRTMYSSGHQIDLITVAHFLRKESNRFAEKVEVLLTKCMSNVVSGAHLESYCVILRELYLEREISKIGKEKWYGDALEQASAIQDMIKKALSLNFDDDWMDMSQMVIALQHHRDTVKGKEILGVPTGFYQLDRILGGLQPTWLIILAARPAVGKSACIAAVAVNAAKLGYKVGVISLEMPAEQSAARFASFYSDVEYWRIFRNNHLNAEQDRYVAQEMAAMSTLPIYTSSKTNVTAMAIRAKAEKLKKTKGLDLLIIDYLQLIETEGKANETREREVAKLSRAMKLLAMDLKIPIIVLCQLNRDSEKPGAPKKPRMSQMRESGALEQDADVVILLHRDWKSGILENDRGESTEREADLIIEKHRSGETDTLKIEFNPDTMKFFDNPPIPINNPHAGIHRRTNFDENPF